MSNYPKIGIRPTIDGRQGGVRESLEEKTMSLAKAVAEQIHKWYPDKEVKIASAQGLNECRKLLTMAKLGKYDGYLLEGMGCPGGCIAGAGTLADPRKTAAVLAKYSAQADLKDPEESAFISNIHFLKDDDQQ